MGSHRVQHNWVTDHTHTKYTHHEVYQFNHLNMCTLVAFSTFSVWCSHHHYLFPEPFHQHKKKTMSPLVVTPHDAPPALGNHRTGLRHQRDKRSRWEAGILEFVCHATQRETACWNPSGCKLLSLIKLALVLFFPFHSFLPLCDCLASPVSRSPVVLQELGFSACPTKADGAHWP